ncbi:MAG: tetratricopeptide repeat protein [Kofleriaceae bacterium]
MSVEVPDLDPETPRQTRALEEANTVSRWAKPTTPEWVRCMGAIWETFETDELLAQYRELFAPMFEQARDPLGEIEVVIRQLRERGHKRAANVAAQIGIAAYPEESWMLSVAANCARQVGDAKAALALDLRCVVKLSEEERGAGWTRVANSALAAGDLEQAKLAISNAREYVDDDGPESNELTMIDIAVSKDRDRAFALFEELAEDPEELAESHDGHRVVELCLDLLLPHQDRRALAVAQALLDAKLELWGECPSVWLERHNLGTVYAQLGDRETAVPLIREARDRLLAQFGSENPHVQMCERSLARVTTAAS